MRTGIHRQGVRFFFILKSKEKNTKKNFGKTAKVITCVYKKEKKERKEILLLRVFVKVKQEDLLVSLNRRMNVLLVTLMNEDEKEALSAQQ